MLTRVATKNTTTRWPPLIKITGNGALVCILVLSPGSCLLFLFCYEFRHCPKNICCETIVQWWLLFFNRGPLGQTHNKERSLEAVNSITLDHFWTSLYKHSSEIEASCIFNKFNLRETERVCERARGWSHREREAYATKERNIRLEIDQLRGQNAHPAHHHPLLKPQGCFKTAPYTA